MAGHDMGPSNVEGFHQQCRNCGALDTEIRFALGDECPNAPDKLIRETHTVPSQELEILEAKTPAQHAAVMQATWFQGYFSRQLARAFNR